MRHNAIRTIACIAGATLLAALIGGCASSGHQEATHRWVSSSNATDIQYRADNSACVRDTVGTTSQRVFDTNTPEYWKYVACMNGRGYALTASEVASTR
jgi:hypothetical protein